MLHAIIIDDNANNMDVLAEMLAFEEIMATKVQDPRKLAALLEFTPQFDLVFVDLEMPNINGYQVLDYLKSDPRFQSVKVVACTVYINEINTARSKGFHSFLAKPLNVDRFPAQLRRILDDQPVWVTA